MGKRKKSSRKPQGPKKKEPLPTAFACLFCNHESSVSVKMDKKGGTGELSCKICGQQFQTGINYLSAAVDVYSDWIDACDAVAKDAVGHEDGGQDYSGGSGVGSSRFARADDELEMNEDDEDDAEPDYGE